MYGDLRITEIRHICNNVRPLLECKAFEHATTNGMRSYFSGCFTPKGNIEVTPLNQIYDADGLEQLAEFLQELAREVRLRKKDGE